MSVVGLQSFISTIEEAVLTIYQIFKGIIFLQVYHLFYISLSIDVRVSFIMSVVELQSFISAIEGVVYSIYQIIKGIIYIVVYNLLYISYSIVTQDKVL